MDKEKKIDIPQKYIDMINGNSEQQEEIINKMLNTSMKVTRLEEELEARREELEKEKKNQRNIRQELLHASKTTRAMIEKAFKHLGLDKEKDYHWNFVGDAFVGTLTPPHKCNKGGK